MKRANILLDFYNAISLDNAETIGDIPIEVLEFLSVYEYNDLCKGFVARHFKKGWGHRAIIKFYSLPNRLVRKIGNKVGKMANNY